MFTISMVFPLRTEGGASVIDVRGDAAPHRFSMKIYIIDIVLPTVLRDVAFLCASVDPNVRRYNKKCRCP